MWTHWDGIDDRARAADAALHVGGRHYTHLRPHIEHLIRTHQLGEALDLLETVIAGLVSSSGLSGASMPTWHMSTATWLCRRRREWAREVALYEAWEAVEHGPRRFMWAPRHAEARRHAEGQCDG